MLNLNREINKEAEGECE